MTPKTNVADRVGQINQYPSGNSTISTDKLKLIRKSEVLAVNAVQIQDQSDDEIRSLVRGLVAQRQNLFCGVQS